MGKYLDKEGLGHLAQRLGAGKSVVSNLSDIGTVASDDSVGLMIDAERLAVGTGSVSTSQNAVIGTIPAATQEAAGVMSAADKKKLDEDVALKEDVESAEFTPTGLEVESELEKIALYESSRLTVRLSYGKGGEGDAVEGSCLLNFPLAQPYQNSVYIGHAGLMSAADKAKLNAIPSTKYVKSIRGAETVYTEVSATLRCYMENVEDGVTLAEQLCNMGSILAATQEKAGVMSAADKAKLDGLDAVATQKKAGLMSAADKKKLDGLDAGELALLDDVDSVDFVPTGIVAETVAQAVVNNNSCPMVEMTLEYDKGGAGGSVKGTFTVKLNTATASKGALKGVGGLMSGDDKAKLDGIDAGGLLYSRELSGDVDLDGVADAGLYRHDGTGTVSHCPADASGQGFGLAVLRTSPIYVMQVLRVGNPWMAGAVYFREFMAGGISGSWYKVDLGAIATAVQ